MSAWHRALDELVAEARAKAKFDKSVTEASEGQARRVLAGVEAPTAAHEASSDADVAFRRIAGWSVGLSLQSVADVDGKPATTMRDPTWIMSFMPRPYSYTSIHQSRMLAYVGAPADLKPWLTTARGALYYRWAERPQ